MTDPDDPALRAGDFIDSDHPAVVATARQLMGDAPATTAVAFYAFVRDAIRYDPSVDYTDPVIWRASAVLAAGSGYCVGKASLYTALCRAAGIPAMLGLADVRNHLATPRLLEATGTDLFSYHGFAEIRLGERMLKVSPIFNASLCERLGVEPLAFDGEGDALMQPADRSGRTFMVYEADHGRFADVPARMLLPEMARLYPKLAVPGGLRGRMESEAARPA